MTSDELERIKTFRTQALASGNEWELRGAVVNDEQRLIDEVERLRKALVSVLALVPCTCGRSDVHAADCALTLALRQAGRL
ncbi:MAG TPA: hypothetical protein VGW38_20395 [Chloroflexota bacterium]|nr:hypothetical protein [Chloroflexota bacterium]